MANGGAMGDRLTRVMLMLVLGGMVVGVAVLHEGMQRIHRDLDRLARRLPEADASEASDVPNAPNHATLGAEPVPEVVLPQTPAKPQPRPRVVVAGGAAPASDANRSSEPSATDAEVPAPNDAHSAAPDAPHAPPLSADATASERLAEPARDAPATPAGWERFGPTVEKIIADVFAGKYDRISARFDKDMAAALPPERLAAALDPIRARAGGIKAVVDRRSAPVALPADLHAYNVTVQTENAGRLVFTITLDDQKRLAGLYVK